MALSDLHNPLGTLAILGSGETSSQGRKIHDYLMSRLGAERPLPVTMLETPAGFQPNAHDVYRRVGEFMEKSLQNFSPQISYVGAWKVGTSADPNNHIVVAPLLSARYIFSGPGSPTYTTRNLARTRALDYLVQAFAHGSTITLSSAAAIAAGRYVLRVYEIFKAGSDLGWDEGLSLLPRLGFEADPVIVAHWNNAEGGANLDTTRCYMGRERFDLLMEMLPPGTPVLGIEEHTACIFEAGSPHVKVMGAGSATVIKGGTELIVPAGDQFEWSLLREAGSQVPAQLAAK